MPYNVRCELCGLRFDAGYKLDLAVRAGRTRAICPGCRRPRPRSTKADRDWWLASFSMDEIKEMAAALNAWR